MYIPAYLPHIIKLSTLDPIFIYIGFCLREAEFEFVLQEFKVFVMVSSALWYCKAMVKKVKCFLCSTHHFCMGTSGRSSFLYRPNTCLQEEHTFCFFWIFGFLGADVKPWCFDKVVIDLNSFWRWHSQNISLAENMLCLWSPKREMF